MIATTTHTRRPLWVKLARPLVCWYLRRGIASAEAYVRHTRHGAVFTVSQIETLERNITPLRARLAMWEAA